MMGKSLTYAYPQRFADGGVAKKGTTYFEDNSVRDNTGHDMVLVTFDNGEKVYTNKAVAEAMIPGNNFASRDDYNKAFVDFTTDQSNFGKWHDKQVSYDQVIQEDPAVQANRAAIQAYANAINAGQQPDFPSLTSLGTPASQLAGVDKLVVETPDIDPMSNINAGTTAMDGGIGSLVQENQDPGNTQQQQAASGTYGTSPTSYSVGMVGGLTPFYRPPSGQASVPTAYNAPINTQQVVQQASLNSPFRRPT